MSGRTLKIAAAATLLCMSAAGGAPGADEPSDWSRADEAFVRACYCPPVDPGQGSLYRTVIGLLQSARELPAEIRLFDCVPSAPPPQPSEGQTDKAEPRAQTEAVEKDERADQVLVLETPAVDEERLAYSFYLAGKYVQAAQMYRNLHQASPDDNHLLVLLALSERNAGNLKTAGELFVELEKKEEHTQWAGWMLDTLKDLQNEGEGQ